MGRFIIEHTCEDKVSRPQVSYKIREYLANYVSESVLFKEKIILKSKYDTVLSIIFLPDFSKEELPEQQFILGAPTVLESDKIKLYIISVPFDSNCYSDQIEAYVRICMDAIVHFLKKTYKRMNSYEFDTLYKNVDLAYIKTFAYPAPFDEQRFSGDGALVKKVEINYNRKDGIQYKEWNIKPD